MLIEIISFLGLIIGIILSKKFKNELKDIKNFVKIISFTIITIIILNLLLITDFNLIFFLGLIIGGLISRFIKNNYLYYGSILILDDINMIFFSILIFILGLIYPALNNLNKKTIIFSLILFALPFILLLTSISYNNFIIGFSIGGLIIGTKQFNK